LTAVQFPTREQLVEGWNYMGFRKLGGEFVGIITFYYSRWDYSLLIVIKLCRKSTFFNYENELINTHHAIHRDE